MAGQQSPGPSNIGAIAQNLVASAAFTAICGLGVAAGWVRGESLEDAKNWPLWLAGVVVFMALLTATGFLNTLRVWSDRRRVKAASGERLAVLIARLDGDDPQNLSRETVRDAIKSELGDAVHVSLATEEIRLGEGLDVDAERRAHGRAQKWLRDKNCDVMVWGYVRPDKALSLRFATRDDAGVARSYVIGPALELPAEFVTDCAAAIAGRIAVEAAPAYDGSRFLASMLQRTATRIEALSTKPLPIRVLGNVLNDLGMIRWRLSRHVGSLTQLMAAVDAYRAASEVFTEAEPAHWAMAQNGLASALAILGERIAGEAGLVFLNQAIEAYQGAASIYSEVEAPDVWAGIQSNVANVLRILGARSGTETGTVYFAAAASAFAAALRVRTEKDLPTEWAITQNNLGLLHFAIGERTAGEAGLAHLNQAAEAYRAALRVQSETETPADWAMTQNNLGNVLAVIGDRTRGQAGGAFLDSAIEAHCAALRVHTEVEMPVDWAMTQNNLGTSFLYLGRMTVGEVSLKCLIWAVEAYRDALRVRTAATMPADWATTQNNLGNALASLAEKSDASTRLEYLRAAVEAYQETLKMFPEEASAHWAQTQGNLAATEAEIGRASLDPAPVRSAIARTEKMIDVFMAMQADAWAEMAKANLARMEALLAELEAAS